MKAKDIDKKEIKLELIINFNTDEVKESILNRINEDEEFTEESLKTFIVNELAEDWYCFLSSSKISIKDK